MNFIRIFKIYASIGVIFRIINYKCSECVKDAIFTIPAK